MSLAHSPAVHVDELLTTTSFIEAGAFEHNLGTMSTAHPELRLRPHVKAHKCLFSDEHRSFAAHDGEHAGDRVQVARAHVDPTMRCPAWLVRDDHVLEPWPIDLRGWD